MVSSDRAVYENRILVYMDILGFKTLVDDSKGDTALRRRIKKAMEIIYSSARTKLDYSIRKVTTFSDSIVISYPGNKQYALFNIFLDVIHIQLELAALGIMVRGGIAVGECYHDGQIVFGPAMNEAYRVENEVAKWPRVVILRSALEKAIDATVNHHPYALKSELEEIGELIKDDAFIEGIEDGTVTDYDKEELYFVDYLSQSSEIVDYGDEYLEWLRKFRVAIIEGLNRYSSANPELKMGQNEADKIFKKYRWILSYWNSVVDNDDSFFPTPPDIGSENQKKFYGNYRKLKINKRYPYV